MSTLTRAEIDEFWETWLEVNREAERIGDWRIIPAAQGQNPDTVLARSKGWRDLANLKIQ